MNTEENNKFVAVFLLGESIIFSFPEFGYMTTSGDWKTDFTKYELKFHKNWSWLIPAIEKCRESQIFGSQRLISNIDKGLLKLDLGRTYRNIIDFIEWHNAQITTNDYNNGTEN